MLDLVYLMSDSVCGGPLLNLGKVAACMHRPGIPLDFADESIPLVKHWDNVCRTLKRLTYSIDAVL
jgi:hypothetical protein